MKSFYLNGSSYIDVKPGSNPQHKACFSFQVLGTNGNKDFDFERDYEVDTIVLNFKRIISKGNIEVNGDEFKFYISHFNTITNVVRIKFLDKKEKKYFSRILMVTTNKVF